MKKILNWVVWFFKRKRRATYFIKKANKLMLENTMNKINKLLNKEQYMPTPISGYSLESLGWKKDGLTWWKGFEKIEYNGCDWMYFDFPGCVKDENYGVGGLKIVPRKINFVEDLNDKK